MIASGNVLLGSLASPAISHACLKPLKANSIPPDEMAAKSPFIPYGINAWLAGCMMAETSNRDMRITKQITMGIMILIAVKKLLQRMSQRNEKTLIAQTMSIKLIAVS